jgi:hypothetical protein
MTHDSFSVSEEVLKAFEEANNAKVVFLQSGDAGAVLNKAILTKEAPLADLLFGVDNTFLSRALEADIFEPYNRCCWSRSGRFKLINRIGRCLWITATCASITTRHISPIITWLCPKASTI